MTILFFLKPSPYSFPPSGVPNEGWAKKKRFRKNYRKLIAEEELRKRKLRKQDSEILLFLEGLI